MFHPSHHDVPLPEEEFRLLRDLVHERFGLLFGDDQRASLRGRLLARLSSLDLSSFEDYYHYLRFSPQRGEELQKMVSHLTNNETYFFREAAQLQAFSDHVLGALREEKSASGERSLRLLSAGCSTGEEAYTIAMLVHDSGHFVWSWKVDVVGLDVDEAAIARACRGVYFHNSFRGLPPPVRERHFAREDAGERVRESVRRLVRFRLGNLLDPASYADLKPLDVIFCRNVLIYFSDAASRRAVELFRDMLAPGGHLLLGHAESLSRITDAFVPIRFPGAVIYRKPESPA
jgi:chemotaxis protein methyltransferase CheR